MSEKFFTTVLNLLKDRQLSISGISRELKNNGYDQHRLIITGYLRALYDVGFLEELEIPPSKVYTYNHRRQENDIYIMLEDRLREVDSEFRFPVAVHILSSLFNRPCFRYELNLLEVTPKASLYVRESNDERLKEYREDITRFDIPASDKAYEMNGADVNIISKSGEVIFGIMKEKVNLTGLRSRYQATRISDY
ncbi:MAG: hypothetical protein KAR85_02840 [Methanosarcinales archaeon]|nr:hypothetical protein [Methanosarcinales archaeon]